MPNRPQPGFPEKNTAQYWQGVKDGKLLYQVDKESGDVVWPPKLFNPKTGSMDLETRESAGVGTVYTYSVVRQNRMPGFADLGAYTVALVDLDEGFRMFTSVTGVENPLTDISIGMRVKVSFEEQDEGEYPIPVFVPAEG